MAMIHEQPILMLFQEQITVGQKIVHVLDKFSLFCFYLTIQWSEILKIKGENAFMYLKFVIKILG